MSGFPRIGYLATGKVKGGFPDIGYLATGNRFRYQARVLYGLWATGNMGNGSRVTGRASYLAEDNGDQDIGARIDAGITDIGDNFLI